MIRLVHLPRPPEFLMRQMAARVWFHNVQRAQEELAEAERKLLAAQSPQEESAAQRELLEKHRAVAEAREWWP